MFGPSLTGERIICDASQKRVEDICVGVMHKIGHLLKQFSFTAYREQTFQSGKVSSYTLSFLYEQKCNSIYVVTYERM